MPVSSSSNRMPNCEIASIIAFCSLARRENPVLEIRPEPTEHRGPEQDAGEQLAHDRGLADALHRLAQQAADKHQDNELSEENDLGGTFRALLCQRFAGGHQHEQAGHQAIGERASRSSEAHACFVCKRNEVPS